MKKFLKITGISVLSIVVILLIIVGVIGSGDIPSYDIPQTNFQLNSTPIAIERGEKLASMLCASCHLNRETGKLTGKQMNDAPPEFGLIRSLNITNDTEYGIGKWTDNEIYVLLRTGIKRDGQYSPPYMAKLPHMADEDMNAIISFLRSDRPMVKPDPTSDPASEPSFLTKFLCKTAWKPLPLPKGYVELPDTNNAVQWGEYLAINLDCFSCHSADFKSNDFLTPQESVGYFGGGNKPLDMNGNVILTPNLTPDKETGIGNWTKEKFINALKYGKVEGEQMLRYPMIPYTRLTDNEAAAIFAYLQTIPPIRNEVHRTFYD